MNEKDQIQVKQEKLQADAREAVEQADDIRSEIHDVTLAALKEGRLDSARIQKVMETVLAGAREGADKHSELAKEALHQATQGLDEALVKTANASRLAIEEAAGRLEEFSGEQLHSALEDLKNMESLFLNALNKVSRGGLDVTASIFQDLSTHARNSGTEIGRYLNASMGDMETHLPKAAQEALEAAAASARQTGAQIADIASGLLAGIADSLRKNSK